jgi:tetratricopeptide (TPR) repeat protein
VRVNVPVATSRAVPDDAPRTAPVARQAVQPSIPADEELPSIPKRRGAARWIVALVVLGAGAIVAGTVGKQYLGHFLAPKPAPGVAAPVAAPDVAPLLAKADELFGAGDLEGAREQLGRADALTQSVGKPSAPVAGKLARVDVAAADVEWLRLRLLAVGDAERNAEVKRLLERRVERARTSVDAAARLGQDPALASTKADLARLSGDVAGARAVAGTLPSESPESAYAQATLELSEPEPKYPVVIELLGKAVGHEGNLGLGRTALIYALVRSGDGARAQAELASMRERSASAAPSPLLADLVSFVSRESGSAAPAQSALSPVPSVALAPPAPGAPTAAPTPGAAPRMPTDFRARLALASQALGRGDLAQADTFYRSVLNEHPNNTEALAGLADVARRKGQSAEAARMYDQVLASNPSYLPALIGRADQLWAAGDRPGAIKLYRRVLDQVGTSNHYGQHAQSRINEAEGAPKSPSPTPAPAPDSSPIDTTDLE